MTTPAQRDELHRLIDRLPDAELHAAQRFLEFLAEDSISPEFAASIRRGIAQADAGKRSFAMTSTTWWESF